MAKKEKLKRKKKNFVEDFGLLKKASEKKWNKNEHFS